MTLQNAIEEFLIEQQIRGNSPNTVIYYKRCLGFFAIYIGDTTRPVEGLSLSDCKGVLSASERAGNHHYNDTDIYPGSARLFDLVLYRGLFK